MAESAREQYGFQSVTFVPAYVPPHRQKDDDMAPFLHRLAMVRRACYGNIRFQVSDIEAHLPSPSYTAQTLKALIPNFTFQAEPIPVIMGTDALAQLASWYQPELLAKHVLFLQAPRDGQPLVTSVTLEGKEIPLNTRAIEMPPIGISSSEIRERVIHGQSVRYLTPGLVSDYMTWNDLYLS
jgi:nicotinate-nucleotide adenylyltransferase